MKELKEDVWREMDLSKDFSSERMIPRYILATARLKASSVFSKETQNSSKMRELRNKKAREVWKERSFEFSWSEGNVSLVSFASIAILFDSLWFPMYFNERESLQNCLACISNLLI